MVKTPISCLVSIGYRLDDLQRVTFCCILYLLNQYEGLLELRLLEPRLLEPQG